MTGSYCDGVQTLPGIVGALTCLVWLVLETPVASLTGRGNDHRQGSFALLLTAYIVGISAAVFFALWVPWAAISPAREASVAGTLVLWGGIGLRWWAMNTLGGYFTFTVQASADQPVVSHGPYRILRHPGYTGVLLAMVSMGLLLANWLSVLALAVAVVAGMSYRISVEEGALASTLGPAYEDYCSSRKRLIPLVW